MQEKKKISLHYRNWTVPYSTPAEFLLYFPMFDLVK